MKTQLYLLVASLLLATTISALATVRYVNLNNANSTPPYTNWATAATSIQDAVDAAVAGDEVVVTNGTYAGGSHLDQYGRTNCVMVDRPLVLRSVNGPDFSWIDGGGAVRCVYLTNNAVMVGFTLTNGAANGWVSFGGGVFCESSAVLTNCVLTGNSACETYFRYSSGSAMGGGAYGGTLNNCTLKGNTAVGCGFLDGVTFLYDPGLGGGASACTLNNCTLEGNWSEGCGGGASGCTLNNCTLSSNSASGRCGPPLPGGGGGAYGGTLNNCTLTDNSAPWGGGAYGCALNNCTLTGNSANSGGGALGSTLNNCVVSSNTGGGATGFPFVQSCTLNNCTVTGNSGWGASFAILNNCIVYFNSDPNGGNCDPSCTLNYCCTTPLPINGVVNISADPQLASA